MPDSMFSNAEILGLLAGLSLLAFVATLVAIPLLVARIPADYFCGRERPPSASWQRLPPLLRLLALILKNTLGVVFVLAGTAMLVLPGQGLLTILIGLLLVDFPGKFRAERWLVGRPSVLRTLNWLRRQAGRPELEVPPAADD